MVPKDHAHGGAGGGQPHRRVAQGDGQRVGELLSHPPGLPGGPSDSLTARTAQRLTGEGRRRSLARYACAVESVRDPELRAILVPRENAGREAVRLFLAGHGVTDVENRTHTLLTCIDGLVFDRLVSGGEVPREALEGLVAAALR